MKKIKNSRVLIIQNRSEDAKFLQTAINENFPKFNTVCYENVLDAFSDIVYSDYDLVLLDCDVEGYENNAAIKTIRGFKDRVPIIVTCQEKNKFIGLRSVVDGADNYYIIRYDYQKMLCKIISIALHLISPIDHIMNYKPENIVINEKLRNRISNF